MKADLRKETLKRMHGLSPEDKARMDDQLLAAFLAHPAYQAADVIATYLNMDHEFSTAALIARAQKDGKRVCIPKTYPKGKMIFVDYDEDALQPTKFGLLEPMSDQAVDKAEIDLIHVPGVVFNERGFRIGYGAGYYDRYLADYKGRTLSTIYPVQVGAFDQEPHDVAVQEVLIGD